MCRGFSDFAARLWILGLYGEGESSLVDNLNFEEITDDWEKREHTIGAEGN